MTRHEIHNLISLLEDPDKAIYSEVRSRLLEFGADIIPDLENAWGKNFDTLIQSRAEDIIHDIQYISIKNDLKNWINNDNKDLLEAWLIITKYQYPDINANAIKIELDRMSKEVAKSLNPTLTEYEQVQLINMILFDSCKLKGNSKNFHAPQNSYINDVLNTKRGNPLSLSLIYIIVAQKCNLPISGINLPMHFLVAYIDDENLLIGDPVKFYINPFSRGTVLSRRDIERFLNKEKMNLKTTFFTPCANIVAIKRILVNLLNAYAIQGNSEKINDIRGFLDVFKK